MQPDGVGSTYDPGRWTPEFRRWLTAYFADAEPKLVEHQKEEAKKAGQRSRELGSVYKAVNELERAITEALETLQDERAANEPLYQARAR